MKTMKSLCVVGLLLCAPAVVEAQAIEAVTMTSDPNDVVFTLRADKALSAPSVRAYEGSIRVRFPDASAPTSIQTQGDGAAIKLVDVRSGSHGSAVMRVDFGDTSKLASEDIRIEQRKQSVVVRIARDLLPPLREPSAEKPAKKVEPAQLQAAQVVQAPKPAVVEAKLEKPAPLPLAQKAPAPLAKKKSQPLAASMALGASPMPMLVAISAILAVAYGALRLVMRKQAAAPRGVAPIDIVAQKRIGPRHQLVIVRAFGREHLLSIQGGNTTPIATSDELDDTFGDKLALASRIEPGADLVRDVSISQRAPEAEREKKPETNLGGNMIRAALAQRLSAATKRSNAKDDSDGAPRAPEEKALSQAVAGLVRLRREAQL